MRWWAFWRRFQYLSGLTLIVLLVAGGLYALYGHEEPTCFDGSRNGDERGVDCGGSCLRVCTADILPLNVVWAESFKIVDGQYNAVAYIENRNKTAGTPRLNYVFKLYDSDGLITERRGETPVPLDGLYPLFEGKILTGGRAPTRTEIEFADDAIWLTGTAGAEQFTLISRELTSADSKPRLIAELRNEDLFEAQDIEIVATVFDKRKNPLTASKTVVEYFPGRTTQSVVFTWPEPIATTLTSCEVPTDVVLAIDLSGSMNDDGGTPPEPITSVLKAAQSFVTRLKTDDQSGVVTYATNAEVEEILTRNHTDTSALIGDLSIAPKEETGSTNTGEALKKITEELNSSRHNENARKVAILLTDGLATAPDTDPDEYARSAAEALKKTDTILFTIGLGANVNSAFLRSLASTPNHYYTAPSTRELDTIYRNITAAICEEGAAVIEVIPKVESNFPNYPGT